MKHVSKAPIAIVLRAFVLVLFLLCLEYPVFCLDFLLLLQWLCGFAPGLTPPWVSKSGGPDSRVRWSQRFQAQWSHVRWSQRSCRHRLCFHVFGPHTVPLLLARRLRRLQLLQKQLRLFLKSLPVLSGLRRPSLILLPVLSHWRPSWNSLCFLSRPRRLSLNILSTQLWPWRPPLDSLCPFS